MLHLSTALCPTDLATGSRALVRAAAGIAAVFSARLILLHVIRLPPLPPGPIIPGDMGSLLTALHQKAERDLRELMHAASCVGVEATLLTAEGWPATEILRIARAVSADLIVMATHGRTGLHRLMFGSVCEEVTQTAGCPVLALRYDRKRKD